ncbi:MAG: hypothetical protein HY720_29010 [Planctomycetes bacterium]|nr:hypothetical protein [Planctomycetota bacterium]
MPESPSDRRSEAWFSGIKTSPAGIETWFVIPIRRNSEPKDQHVAMLWGLLRNEVYKAAGGWTGPECTRVIRDLELLPGGWVNPATGKPQDDESRKYTVLVEESKVNDLAQVLARATNSFDQLAILFVVQGEGRNVLQDLEKGYLEGDPASG